MRILITGASGFLGRHLTARLSELGHDVTGASRATGFDVTDAAAVRSTITGLEPEAIYHLAGPSFVPDSKKDPRATFDIHVGGTVNVLEAARSLDTPPRVLLAATADAYRPDPERLPFDEDTPQSPENPYAAAKMAQEAIGVAWHATWGLPVVRVRLFNLIGPGQDERFVASSFGRQAAAIKLGIQEPVMEVGDLRVERDFVDWRDGIEGIRLALEKGTPGQVYNIASGRPRALREMLDLYFKAAGIAPEVVQPEHLARPGQALVRCGSARRLRTDTGWRIERSLEESLRAILEDWMERMGGGG